MAGSRLSSFGTIYSRLTGLIEAGATKEVPLWYTVYKKYPPDVEPTLERIAPPKTPIVEIVYQEDFERVKMTKLKMSKDQTEESPELKLPEVIGRILEEE